MKFFIAVLFGSLAISANAAPEYIDYSGASCSQIEDISSKTMSNWQNGTSLRDMLLNTSEFSKEIYNNSEMPLGEAELLTYIMADAAMNESVRKSPYYKDYAIRKFSSDYDLMCRLKQKQHEGYQAEEYIQEFISQHIECRDLERQAIEYMEYRQKGVSKDSLLKTNQEVYEEQLFINRYDAQRVNEVYETIKNLVDDAYLEPLGNNDFEKEKAIIEFGEDYYSECMTI